MNLTSERPLSLEELKQRNAQDLNTARDVDCQVTVTERNWAGVINLLNRISEQQVELMAAQKELLTGKDMEKYLEIVNQNFQKQMDELTMTVSQFSRQAGSLSESFSSASDKLVRRTNSALTEILQDTNSGLTDIFENSKSEQQAVQRDIREIVTQLKQCLKLWTPRILVGLVSVTVILSLLSRLLS